MKREIDWVVFLKANRISQKETRRLASLHKPLERESQNEKGNAKIWRLPGRDVPLPNFGEFIARGVIMENLLTL